MSSSSSATPTLGAATSVPAGADVAASGTVVGSAALVAGASAVLAAAVSAPVVAASSSWPSPPASAARGVRGDLDDGRRLVGVRRADPGHLLAALVGLDGLEHQLAGLVGRRREQVEAHVRPGRQRPGPGRPTAACRRLASVASRVQPGTSAKLKTSRPAGICTSTLVVGTSRSFGTRMASSTTEPGATWLGRDRDVRRGGRGQREQREQGRRGGGAGAHDRGSRTRNDHEPCRWSRSWATAVQRAV